MNPTDPTPPSVPVPPVAPPPTPAEGAPRRRFGCLESAIVSVLLFLLATVLLPTCNSVAVKSPQTKALAQAKQVGLALRLYAGDHDGAYPSVGSQADGPPVLTANDAFRLLFPTYLQSETVFGNRLSVYAQPGPDNNIVPQEEVLRAGENAYDYVSGLTEAMSGNTPLVVDGTDGTGRGAYVSDPTRPGGTWHGDGAIAIYLDNHGAVERLSGPADKRVILTPGDAAAQKNLLAPETLGKSLKLLEPALPAKTGRR